MEPSSPNPAVPSGSGSVHRTALAIDPLSVAPPVGRRLPFGWRTVTLMPPGKGPPLFLRWTAPELQTHPARFRIALACESREPKTIEVSSAMTGRGIGRISFSSAPVFQIFEMPLNADDTTAAVQEGLHLQLTQGAEPVWLFYDEHPASDGRAVLLPHLMFPTDSYVLAEFYNRMASRAVVQSFGWMEGCVLDGLWDLRRVFGSSGFRAAIESHLRLFFDPAGRLLYEKERNQPADRTIQGVESTLPFAVVAKVWPTHPSLELLQQFWDAWADARGNLQDPDKLSIAGCYMTAYPMAVMARLRHRKDLADMAMQQLRLRRDKLCDGQDIYGHVTPDGHKHMRNWARGAGWLLLGYIRTLSELAEFQPPDELVQDAQRFAEWCLARQDSGGLWPCFLGEPQTGIDTCASAAIAAALVQGASAGFLPASARKAAAKALPALIKHLTPDGLLTGASSCAGLDEASQRNSDRFISPAAMGLMAQLIACIAARR